jgi:hypothetical protein
MSRSRRTSGRARAPPGSARERHERVVEGVSLGRNSQHLGLGLGRGGPLICTRSTRGSANRTTKSPPPDQRSQSIRRLRSEVTLPDAQAYSFALSSTPDIKANASVRIAIEFQHRAWSFGTGPIAKPPKFRAIGHIRCITTASCLATATCAFLLPRRWATALPMVWCPFASRTVRPRIGRCGQRRLPALISRHSGETSRC